jgi:hypothetical protein
VASLGTRCQTLWRHETNTCALDKIAMRPLDETGKNHTRMGIPHRMPRSLGKCVLS